MRAIGFLALALSLSGCCCFAGGKVKRISSRDVPMNASSAGATAPMPTGLR